MTTSRLDYFKWIAIQSSNHPRFATNPDVSRAIDCINNIKEEDSERLMEAFLLGDINEVMNIMGLSEEVSSNTDRVTSDASDGDTSH